jgi:ABC-type dipeptide/oligopeptide/nickel transport system ATPase component
VTHELRQVAQLADSVLVIAAGRPVYRAEGEALAPEVLEPAYLAAVEGDS